MADDGRPTASGGLGGRLSRVKARATQILDRERTRHPALDHAVRAFQHFGRVKSNILAGAVTYFGVLSFFPILALIFAVLGFVVRYTSPDVKDAVIAALQDALPGIFSQLDTGTIQSAATAASIVGVLGFLYSGLGWLSAMRTALEAVFEVSQRAKRNAVVAKLVDLAVLAMLGVVLVVSVAASSVVTSLTSTILDAVGLDDVPGSGLVLRVLGLALGVAASTVLFYVILRVLPNATLPAKSLWQGALLSAVGFEILKLLATYVISSTATNPVYGPFAIIVALLVWINYFARLVMLGASWAATAQPRAGVRALETTAAPLAGVAAAADTTRSATPTSIDRAAVAGGVVVGVTAMGIIDLVRRVRNERSQD